MNYFVPCDYDKKVHVCDELTVCFRDAGHLLGSSFIEMWAKEGEDECKLIFSGDIGNGNRALIRDPEIPESADYLIMDPLMEIEIMTCHLIMHLNLPGCWR